VGGDFDIYDSPKLVSVSAPVLESVGDDVYIGGYNVKMKKLESINLPALKHVGGYVEVEELYGPMSDLVLPALVTVGGEVEIDDCPMLVSISAPALEMVGGYVYFGQNMNTLADISLPALKRVGDYVEVVDVAGPLAYLVFPALEFVGRHFEVQEIEWLVSVSAPVLGYIGGQANVTQNPKLRSVALQMLDTAAEGINVVGNPWLISVLAPSLTNVSVSDVDGASDILIDDGTAYSLFGDLNHLAPGMPHNKPLHEQYEELATKCFKVFKKTEGQCAASEKCSRCSVEGIFGAKNAEKRAADCAKVFAERSAEIPTDSWKGARVWACRASTIFVDHVVRSPGS
jgi:hypothetical protein